MRIIIIFLLVFILWVVPSAMSYSDYLKVTPRNWRKKQGMHPSEFFFIFTPFINIIVLVVNRFCNYGEDKRNDKSL